VKKRPNIRIRIRNPEVRIRGSGSVSNRHNCIPVLGKEENINYDSTRVVPDLDREDLQVLGLPDPELFERIRILPSTSKKGEKP
jgi:hypothetical protein